MLQGKSEQNHSGFHFICAHARSAKCITLIFGKCEVTLWSTTRWWSSQRPQRVRAARMGIGQRCHGGLGLDKPLPDEKRKYVLDPHLLSSCQPYKENLNHCTKSSIMLIMFFFFFSWSISLHTQTLLLHCSTQQLSTAMCERMTVVLPFLSSRVL